MSGKGTFNKRLPATAASTTAPLGPVSFHPVLVFFEEIGTKSSLETRVFFVAQRLNFRHPVLAAHALVGRVHEYGANLPVIFHPDCFDGISLDVGQVEVGLDLGQPGLHGLSHSSCISSHATTLGAGRREAKERQDKCPASDQSFNEIH